MKKKDEKILFLERDNVELTKKIARLESDLESCMYDLERERENYKGIIERLKSEHRKELSRLSSCNAVLSGKIRALKESLHIAFHGMQDLPSSREYYTGSVKDEK